MASKKTSSKSASKKTPAAKAAPKATSTAVRHTAIPREIEIEFIRANSWDTALRYNPGNLRAKYALEFLSASRKIFAWGAGRLG